MVYTPASVFAGEGRCRGLCNHGSMERLELNRLPGVRFIPNTHGGTGVLVLAGSSGRIDENRAQVFAEQGAIAESIQWFGAPGQHDGPWDIALETFLERVDNLAIDCDRIVLVGTSFGSEAALLTAANHSRVAAVAAFAPSDVVWTGVTSSGRTTSHWTLRGTPLPHVPFVDDWEPSTNPPAFTDFYATCRRRYPAAVEGATIPVEQIPEVLVVAGGDDQVWPSVLHAKAIAARRAAHRLATTVVTDPDAGHRTVLPGEQVVHGGMHMARGGNEEADRRLGNTVWPHLTALLQTR